MHTLYVHTCMHTLTTLQESEKTVKGSVGLLSHMLEALSSETASSDACKAGLDVVISNIIALIPSPRYVYVCMWRCICICLCVDVFVLMHLCLFWCCPVFLNQGIVSYVYHIHPCIHSHPSFHPDIRTSRNPYIHPDIHSDAHFCIHTDAHTYTCIRIHVHTQSHSTCTQWRDFCHC